MANVVLIGMPSAGKSSAGRILAEKLGYGFADSDRVIEAEEGAPLPQLLERLGAENFLLLEARVNCGLSRADRCVIATGGSAVYSETAIKRLKETGKTVYLRQDPAEIGRRIPDFRARGVVMRGEVRDLPGLLEERAPLYERYADLTVDCGGKSAEEIAEEIAGLL